MFNWFKKKREEKTFYCEKCNTYFTTDEYHTEKERKFFSDCPNFSPYDGYYARCNMCYGICLIER